MFKICLAAERIIPNVHTYREKLIHLNRLDSKLVEYQLYEPTDTYDKVSNQSIFKGLL